MSSYSKLISFLLMASVLTAVADASATDQTGGGKAIEVIDFNALTPRLSQDNDSIYVVNFWATWCAPCVRELPHFEKLGAAYKNDKVRVILVSLDFPNHLESRVIPFIERHNLQSELILLDDPDANRWIPLVSEEWTGAIPATVIYSGSLRRFYQREFSYEELEAILLDFL